MVTLFIPHSIKGVDSGYISLAGKYRGYNGLEHEEIAIIVSDEIHLTLQSESIGVITKETSEISQRATWIEINNSHRIVFENVIIDGQRIPVNDMTVVYYNSCDILSSSILKRFYQVESMNSIDYFIRTILRTKPLEKSNSSLLIKYIFLILSFLRQTLNFVSANLERLCCFLNSNFEFKSVFLNQLLLRTKQLQFIFQNNDCILVGRIFFIVVTDVIMGAVTICLITTHTSPVYLHLKFLLAAKNFAIYILDLLDWLKGMPAGLKLNQPAAEALSSFFSYIVYLLLFYLELSSGPLLLLANLFVYIGFIGVSFQAALLVDLLKLLTLHIYCLYIYAARIHMAQLSLLGTQWRGFRGKKWNPLKNRIDSRDESIMRPSVKIFTVVIFTFVIFLLPTSTVYYTVFLTLRLMLLSIQSFAIFLIWALNSNPIYVFWLSFIGSPSVNGDVSVELDWNKSCHSCDPLTMKLNLCSSSVSKILEASMNEDIFPSCPSPSFTYIWNSLIYARELL